MKGIKTLIRLHKRQLDTLRREMADLERQKDRLLEASRRIAAELAREIALSSEYSGMALFFGDFAKRIQRRQEQIAGEIAKLDVLINELREKIAEGFSELKKYELAYEQHLRREAEARERKERLFLDEIGMQQFTRQEEAEG